MLNLNFWCLSWWDFVLQYQCVMLQTVLTHTTVEYLVCFIYQLNVVCFRCKVPGVMDGDEPRSFVTLYELDGSVYTHSLQLQCFLSVKVIIN